MARCLIVMVALSPTKPSSRRFSASLLSQAQTGSDAAIEALIARCEPRIFALARAILKEPALAEDVTQETLLRLVQQLPTLDTRVDTFDTWLLCVARNLAIGLLRKRRVRGEMEFSEDHELPDPSELRDTEPAPLEMIAALEDAGRISAALDQLPSIWREIVILRYYHDLEPAEIGTVIGDSAVNVRVRLFRAIRELRSLLQDKEGSK